VSGRVHRQKFGGKWFLCPVEYGSGVEGKDELREKMYFGGSLTVLVGAISVYN